MTVLAIPIGAAAPPEPEREPTEREQALVEYLIELDKHIAFTQHMLGSLYCTLPLGHHRGSFIG